MRVFLVAHLMLMVKMYGSRFGSSRDRRVKELTVDPSVPIRKRPHIELVAQLNVTEEQTDAESAYQLKFFQLLGEYYVRHFPLPGICLYKRKLTSVTVCLYVRVCVCICTSPAKGQG